MRRIVSDDYGEEWVVRCCRGDMHQGPHVELLAEYACFHNQSMDTDDLARLILTLQACRVWLLEQDPEEREYGPRVPPIRYRPSGGVLTTSMVRDLMKAMGTSTIGGMTGDVKVPFVFLPEMKESG